MGSGSSFMQEEECDIISDNGVIKRIPIEVKPRRTLRGSFRGGGRSFIRRNKGASLRSALSVDLENTEVEKIRKEYEMLKISKQNETSDLQKKQQKLESENRRLRAELQALQKNSSKLRHERDIALDAEYQALERATTFENERDKVQRQFKIFRETKEGEIQNLLKTRRELENKLQKTPGGHHSVLATDNADSTSRGGDLFANGNPGDWWTALESEPSLGSTTQLQPMFKGPEFAHSLGDIEGPFTTVNREDWNAVAATLAQTLTSFPETVQSTTLRLYVSAPRDMHTEVEILRKEYLGKLQHLCEMEGRFFVMVHLPFDDHTKLTERILKKELETRQRQIQKCSIFLAFLGEHTNRFTNDEFEDGFQNNPGARPAIFCFRNPAFRGCKSSQGEARQLKGLVRESGKAKIIDLYDNPRKGSELAFTELEKIVRLELGLENKRTKESDSGFGDEEGEELCTGCIWDLHNDYEHLEAFSLALNSTCELGFEKHYGRLNDHVSASGPLPPLVVSGNSGSGKSLALAKWINLLHKKHPNTLVLYHFVGGPSTVSADPVHMIRRFTAQLMQHVTAPPPLTCEPGRLVEEFPKWLERVSSKLQGGVVLVIDALDQFRNAEIHLKWLLDPLPVDTRVVVSVDMDTCPPAWRSWPTIHLEPFSSKQVKELIQALCIKHNHRLSSEHESRILAHCRTPSTRNPLYLTILLDEITSGLTGKSVTERLDSCLQYPDTLELYRHVMESLEIEFEDNGHRGMLKRAMQLIYGSRNGLSEAELMKLLPDMTWSFWAPLFDALQDRHILVCRSGLLNFEHEQAREGVQLSYCSGAYERELNHARRKLIDFYSCSLGPSLTTCRVADELPWLVQMMGNKDYLKECISNLCVFKKLYARGRCSELIGYWQYLGADKSGMASSYFNTIKKFEDSGMITLPKIAEIYETLGRFLKDLALLKEAMTPLQKALEIYESLDPDQPCVAGALYQLAGLHGQWNKFATAEALYKQALEISENAYGTDHHNVAKILDALAVLYQKQEKHEQADMLRRRAVAIRQKCKQPRAHSGQLGGIDPLKRRALQLEELVLGPDSVDVAKSLNELGVLYYLQDNQETAEAYFKKALDMRESVLGPDHPDVAQSLNNLAALYNDKKEYSKAEPLYERALEIRQKSFQQQDHPNVASTIKHLAVLYKKQGKNAKAEPLYKQAVDIREKSFGCTHPSVATALVNLAVLYCEQNKHTEALPLYERALKIYEDALGPNHPRVAETLRNLAVLRYEQNDFETAAKLYRRATDIKELEQGFGNKAPSRRSSTCGASTMRHIPVLQAFYT
ncbi:nephrocystin-3-like [Ptychodera flava]|uniref:nephrocystin-3-like n=1 Tax=Ptychodera flava TaxID=63121 RepID=UPI00396A883D